VDAHAALSLKPGMILVSADGRRVGRIERVLGSATVPTAVTVIRDYKFLTIPANTLAAGAGMNAGCDSSRPPPNSA
jgi:hypothetical protein